MMAEPHTRKTFPVKPRLKTTSNKPYSSPESKFWRSFRTHQIPDLIFPISSLDFSPILPYDLAATFSASVTLYDSQSFEPKSKITKFSDVAFSAKFRPDGKLLAAGGQSGLIQIFDAKTEKKTENPLRKLRGHTGAVQFVDYPRFDKLHLVSGGDDSVVKYWDVVSETEVVNFLGHKDYVRCGSPSPASSDLFATGSYDHTVKLWDSRVSSAHKWVAAFNHGKIVEDVVFLPSGGLLATAGGDSVKIWDVIGGGKLVHTMESHTKTVTSICVGKVGNDGGEGEKCRLLSVSLDGYMKVLDYSTLKIIHSMRYPLPLLSIAFSPDCTRAIGTSNGVLYFAKTKKKESNLDENVGEVTVFGSVEEPKKQVLRPTYYRYFQRGQSEKAAEGDYVIKRAKKMKGAKHNKLLRKFRHQEALVAALSTNDPHEIVAVMQELVARRKLLKCVSNLDVDELELLLKFLAKWATMTMYSGFLQELSKRVLQLRVEDIIESDALKKHVQNLKRSVLEEIRIEQSLQEIQGIISPLLRIAGRT